MTAAALLLTACGNVSFDKANDSSGTAQAIRSIKPTLAVRGISCLMCHADIRSNVVTDFGYGTPQFLGGTGRQFEGESWFNNYVQSWQTALNVNGTVYVPNAKVTPEARAVLGTSWTSSELPTVVQLMNTAYNSTNNWDGNAEQARSPMTMKIKPDAGDPVVALNKITIRSPTEAEIQALAPALFLSAGESGYARVNSSAPVQLKTVVGQSGQKYLMNDESTTLECAEADIVVKGTLYLRGLKVNASKGCRLYVSGSVFIEDGITYVGGGEKQNLQITSANAISMGVAKDFLNQRIADRRYLEFYGSRTYADRTTQLRLEHNNVGVLKDAGLDYGAGVRASFDYNGLLLNAPIVWSRYLGQVHGTIIAEVALFSLSNFHFQYDSVFGDVNVLPLIRQPLLEVKQ